MKKLLFRTVLLSALSVSVALATDVDISIDNGAATRYVLQNLSIPSTGALTVSVTSTGAAPVDPTYVLTITTPVGGTITPDKAAPYTCTGSACPSVVLTAAPSANYTFARRGGACASAQGTACTVVMSTSQTVSATFTSTVTPPAGDACNPAGTTLVDVTTSLPTASFPRTDYRPTPTTVYSFAFKTVPAGAAATGNLSVAQLSSSMGGKLVVVSECRGDVDTTLTATKTAGCYRFGAETSTVPYIVNNTAAFKPTVYCNLKPNTQYYFNVVPRQTTTGDANCTSTSNCGFSFLAN